MVRDCLNKSMTKMSIVNRLGDVSCCVNLLFLAIFDPKNCSCDVSSI